MDTLNAQLDTMTKFRACTQRDHKGVALANHEIRAFNNYATAHNPLYHVRLSPETAEKMQNRLLYIHIEARTTSVEDETHTLSLSRMRHTHTHMT